MVVNWFYSLMECRANVTNSDVKSVGGFTQHPFDYGPVLLVQRQDWCTFSSALFWISVSTVSRSAGRLVKTAAERNSRQKQYNTRSETRRKRHRHMMMHTSALDMCGYSYTPSRLIKVCVELRYLSKYKYLLIECLGVTNRECL